ncbi:MAG: hypothetical protein ACR2OZ_19235 [Verrucomicrobiales bacterium]
MNDQAIEAFTRQLESHPEDWHVRAHLAGLLEAEGDRHGAAQVIMTAESPPAAREHILAAVRILTPVNPAASLPYLQLLGQAGAPTFGGGASSGVSAFGSSAAQAVAPPPSQLRSATSALRDTGPPAPVTPFAASEVYAGATYPAQAPDASGGPDVSPAPGEIHLTVSEKPHFGTRRFTIVLVAHVAALVIAGAVVIATYIPKGKDNLTFEQTPPRSSATKGTEVAVKMAKKKNSSSAPASQKRVLAKNSLSAITLQAIETPSPLADTNFSAMGMGGAGLGFGLGGTGGQGTGGAGIGGGRGRFMGAFNTDSRCSKGDRDKRIAESGGVPETELHVKKSLDWLKKSQNPDGSWGSQHKGSMSGLALLSYLGHCETPDSSKDYGDTVLKGIMFMVELQMKKGGLSEKDKASNGFPYEHGIGTYALAEAYSMTRYGTKRIPNLREAVVQAVDVIIKGQAADGGWNYGYDPQPRQPNATASDMSVAGWQIQALNAARHTGMDFPGINECYTKIGEYLKRDFDEGRGGFGYAGVGEGRSPTMSMTGVGGLALFVHGKSNTGDMRKTIKYLEDYFEEKKRYFKYDETSGSDPGLYGSYYINQVAFMHGRSFWRKWNKSLQEELLPAQNPDGSYRKEGGPGGSHSSEGAGPDADLFRTCLCTLMLEVYYRYLPATEKHMGSKLDQ